MKLIVKSPVWDDLREIGAWIGNENPEAANRFIEAAEKAFELLRRHPRIGRLRTFSVAGVRSWMIPEFQKYIPTKTEVQILAVVHGARDISVAVEKHLK